ncbi:phosphatase PAP2 family protein [Cobetia sp. L2A1]|uniref:phosphatase PAP2 family protein n=1 Tax=Cobetia sp. L2A1 TaxID=2686360 RepID=UPI00131A99FD|nr:phosphatase PAP2 family protein [Cobetia sp. L2A1]
MHLRRPLVLNAIGLVLLACWWIPALDFWAVLDSDVFWGFNLLISPLNPHWDTLLGLLNTRTFDAFAFLMMGVLFVWAMLSDERPHRYRHWLSIGITMLLTAGLISLFVLRVISYEHASPTRMFAHAQHLSELVSFKTKDSASNSFPGDHGLMLMVFAGYMLAFAPRHIALWSLIFVVILSAPRIMVGAHWFSDVYLGSLSIALTALPWVLCTPLAHAATSHIEHSLERLDRRRTLA